MSVKSAFAQDRGFQRKLRRKPGPHLFLGARRAGLVIEDGIAAVVAAARYGRRGRAAGSCPCPTGSRCSPRISASISAIVGAALDLPVREPARDALEARPPERARLGIVFDLGKMLAPERDAVRPPDRRAGSSRRSAANSPMAAWMKCRARRRRARHRPDRAAAAAECAWRKSCRDRAANARSR